ncbi:SagB/ThcOx family dehydrogenase [Salinivirga cyanobacteriivorans]|nr:SagB/ThcOx family dehydrogenase [Salinivirga cyanobacteriivorans]
MRHLKLFMVVALVSLMACNKETSDMENQDSIKLIKENPLTYRLPSPRLESDMSAEEVMKKRRSHRHFVSKSIDASDVSQVLWAAYGITQKANHKQLRGGFRTAPSAGALYPLELYLLVDKVNEIEPGVYRYLADGHQIQQTIDHNVKLELSAAALNQKMIHEAPACLFYSAIYERTTEKYGSRGENRYVCMDLGHSAQNVYLQVEALHMGTCAIGAFSDDKVREVMQLPAKEEPLYIMPFGHYYNKREF